MLDLKIMGGTIVDGTGAERFRGDLGVKDGRIVAIGDVAEEAKETVDATGRIVSPGFVDIHTHYDAQVFWDPTLSPSCFHGVTTILGGFCGFSIAPISPEASDYLMRMLARVEGMPLETLQIGVPWNWRSFGEFLDRFEGRVGLNAGFFAGHSAIRRVVMGERAVGAKATPEEIAAMKALLGKSLAEGALGFSSTISASHNDGDGNPVPSRWADHSEIVELGSVVKDYEGTGLELLPEIDFAPEIRELITQLSLAGNRPVNWNALGITDRPDARKLAAHQLAVTDYARSRGAEVVALTVPVTPDMFVNFKTGVLLDANPGVWRELFKWPIEKRIEAFRDPDFRDRMRADLERVPAESFAKYKARMDRFTIVSVSAEKNKKYQGRFAGDVAREEGRDPLDVILDIAIDDELTTVFAPYLGGNDAETFKLRAEVWHDDRTIIGASDAGAHLDMVDTFSFSTNVLSMGVRGFGIMTLEEAVYQLTDRPARYMGLIDRGRLKQGYHADIVIFDEATVGRGPTYFREDVPGNQARAYAEATGIDHVYVNGVEIVRMGEHTGELPGKVLRSGKDTRTVPLDALRENRRIELMHA
jgi:N-acyl-D-aspartate/D-glutamate deacylase